jgi:hypothetical protein
LSNGRSSPSIGNVLNKISPIPEDAKIRSRSSQGGDLASNPEPIKASQPAPKPQPETTTSTSDPSNPTTTKLGDAKASEVQANKKSVKDFEIKEELGVGQFATV